MENSVKPYQFLNRDVIKYIAIVAMLFDHMSLFFMGEIDGSGGPVYIFFINIGTFTAVTMVYFLVEGYYHTRSRKNYITRLLIFALISQMAWNFAMAEEGQLWTMGKKLNMIFTLCICFGIIYILDTEKNIYIKTTLVILCIYLSQYCDWAWLAPLYTIAFVWGRKSRKHMTIASIICLLLYMIVSTIELYFESLSYVEMGLLTKTSIIDCFQKNLYSGFVMLMALICLLFLYNGKQMTKGRVFSKWFFYIFYPTHMVILRIIDLIIH